MSILKNFNPGDIVYAGQYYGLKVESDKEQVLSGATLTVSAAQLHRSIEAAQKQFNKRLCNDCASHILSASALRHRSEERLESAEEHK